MKTHTPAGRSGSRPLPSRHVKRALTFTAYVTPSFLCVALRTIEKRPLRAREEARVSARQRDLAGEVRALRGSWTGVVAARTVPAHPS